MIVVRNDHDIWTFDDLEGKRIAVQATTKAEDLFLHRIESDLPTVSQVNCFSATEDMFAAIRKNYKSRAGKPRNFLQLSDNDVEFCRNVVQATARFVLVSLCVV